MRPVVLAGAVLGAAGLGLAVLGRSSSEPKPAPVLPVANGVDKTRHLSDDFFRALEDVTASWRAKGAGVTSEDLLNCFMGESGVSTTPENPNSHCAGLNGMCPSNFPTVGFFPGTDKEWQRLYVPVTLANGKTTYKLSAEQLDWVARWKALDPVTQLSYVRRYFEAKNVKLFRNVGDLYLANFAPAFLGSSDDTVIFRPPSNEYEWNKVIDQDPTKGYIEVADMARYMEKARWSNNGPYSNPKKDKPGAYWAELLFRLKRVREQASGDGPRAAVSGDSDLKPVAGGLKPAPGPLLLLGDSITVGYAPFVKADGGVRRVAEVGQTSTWLLGQVKGSGSRGELDGVKAAVVLTGTNDVGGLATPEKILSNVLGIRDELRSHGVDVYLATLPPFKGWWNYARYYAETEGKRKALNEGLRQAATPGRLVPLDALVADPNDPEKLSSYYDSGDHLHPRGDRLGPLVQAQLAAGPTPLAEPAIPPSSPAGPVLAGVVGAGLLAWWLGRKFS